MLTLNYPVYFYAAIKDNTALDQYEVFNILFIGDTYQNNGCNAVSQGSSSNFTAGRRKITKKLLLDIFGTPRETIIKRIQMLHLKDSESAARILNRILTETTLLATKDNAHLLSFPTDGQIYGYLADFFLYSLEHTDTTHLLTADEKRMLDIFRIQGAAQMISKTDEKLKAPSIEVDATRYISPHVAHSQFQDYRILEECIPTEKVRTKPVGFWRLRLFAFLIRDSSGKCFLPLQLQHYGGIWTVPHVGKKLDLHCRARLAKTLSTEIKEYSSKFDSLFRELEEQQFYQMGLFSSKSTLVNSYVEYKTSIALAGAFQCYHIEECKVFVMDEDEIINIIDPEGYNGYRYLPINSDGKICMDSPYVKAAVDGMGIWFFDHLLSTNIINLIRNMNGFESCTYDSPDGVLMSETGIIST